jgi:hypothetical protein
MQQGAQKLVHRCATTIRSRTLSNSAWRRTSCPRTLSYAGMKLACGNFHNGTISAFKLNSRHPKWSLMYCSVEFSKAHALLLHLPPVTCFTMKRASFNQSRNSHHHLGRKVNRDPSRVLALLALEEAIKPAHNSSMLSFPQHPLIHRRNQLIIQRIVLLSSILPWPTHLRVLLWLSTLTTYHGNN